MSRFVLSSCLFAALLTGFSGPVPGENSALAAAFAHHTEIVVAYNVDVGDESDFLDYLDSLFPNHLGGAGIDDGKVVITFYVNPPKTVIWPGHGSYRSEIVADVSYDD